MKLYVLPENYDFNWYPYFYTFKFYNQYKARFSNSDYYDFSYVLTQSNGEVERERDPEQDEYWDDDEQN